MSATVSEESCNCSPSVTPSVLGKRREVQQGHSPLSKRARCLLKEKLGCTLPDKSAEMQTLLDQLRSDFPKLHVDSSINEGWITVSRCVSKEFS